MTQLSTRPKDTPLLKPMPSLVRPVAVQGQAAVWGDALSGVANAGTGNGAFTQRDDAAPFVRERDTMPAASSAERHGSVPDMLPGALYAEMCHDVHEAVAATPSVHERETAPYAAVYADGRNDVQDAMYTASLADEREITYEAESAASSAGRCESVPDAFPDSAETDDWSELFYPDEAIDDEDEPAEDAMPSEQMPVPTSVPLQNKKPPKRKSVAGPILLVILGMIVAEGLLYLLWYSRFW